MKFIHISCFFINFYLLILVVDGFGGFTRTGSLNSMKSLNNEQKIKSSSNNVVESQQVVAGNSKTNKSTSSYLSAWGIISIIMLIIVGSAFIYYLTIFYPLVCAKRGKYDVMEMAAL